MQHAALVDRIEVAPAVERQVPCAAAQRDQSHPHRERRRRADRQHSATLVLDGVPAADARAACARRRAVDLLADEFAARDVTHRVTFAKLRRLGGQ
jgi:hypothetical protein